MSSFDLRRLRYFVSVAELGSVTRAARELYVAQPALSHHMKELELEVGGELFARSARGVQLTKLGERLLDRARTLLNDIETLKDELQGAPASPQGVVVIGMAPTIGTVLSGPVMATASQQIPMVRVQIRETMSRDLPDLIRGGVLDFGLSYDIAPARGIQSTPIFHEDSYLVGLWSKAKLHRGLERKGSIAFRLLEEIPLFLSGPANVFREHLQQVASARHVKLNIVGEIDSLAVRRELALAGVGFTILSAAAIRSGPHDKDLFAAKIVRPQIRRQICFVRTNQPGASRAATEVAQIVERVLRVSLTQSVWAGVSGIRKGPLFSVN